MKQAIAAAIVRWTGFDTLLRAVFARRRVSIVVYHDPEPEALRRHLDWLSQRYSFTTLDAVADAMESGRWGDLPPYPLAITIDDGHRNNAKLESLFREYGVRPTVYLCSRIVGTTKPYWWKTPAAERLGTEWLKRLPDAERRRRLAAAGNDPDREAGTAQALTWAEVRRLATVYDYGGHTRTHPILLNCDDEHCAEEIALCKTELEEATGRPCRHFAFPNGDYGPRELKAIRRAGYRTARTIAPGWNGAKTDPLQLKAMAVSDDASIGWLRVQMTGLPAVLRKLRGGYKADPVEAGSGQTAAVA